MRILLGKEKCFFFLISLYYFSIMEIEMIEKTQNMFRITLFVG